MSPEARVTRDAAGARGHLVVEQFSAWFGSARALARIDLDLPVRAVTAVIGPSGCGKTTLLRAMNRLNELIPGATSDGRVLLDGENIYAPGVDGSMLRQRIGMVFQRWNPFCLLYTSPSPRDS